MENFEEYNNEKEIIDQINDILGDFEKKKRGRPRIHPIVIREPLKPQYNVTYKGETKEFYSMREVAGFTGKSQTCLFRILDYKNKYKKKNSIHLKQIKITRINKI